LGNIEKATVPIAGFTANKEVDVDTVTGVAALSFTDAQ